MRNPRPAAHRVDGFVSGYAGRTRLAIPSLRNLRAYTPEQTCPSLLYMCDTEHMYFTEQSADTISRSHANAVGLIEKCRGRGGRQEAGEMAPLMLVCARVPVLHQNLRALALDILVIQGWSEFYHRIRQVCAISKRQIVRGVAFASRVAVKARDEA